MKQWHIRGGFLTLVLTVLAGCGGGTEPPVDGPLTGEWFGRIDDVNGPTDITFKLAHRDDVAITGTVTVVADEFTFPGDVEGTFDDPAVRLDLEIDVSGDGDIATAVYRGRLVTEGRMEGTFTPDNGNFFALGLDRRGE